MLGLGVRRKSQLSETACTNGVHHQQLGLAQEAVSVTVGTAGLLHSTGSDVALRKPNSHHKSQSVSCIISFASYSCLHDLSSYPIPESTSLGSAAHSVCSDKRRL